MATMGRPTNLVNNKFRNVQMAPKQAAQTPNIKDKKKFLDEITGYREKSQFADLKTHNKMGKDEFLKLLTFQLQNQDPINPMDQKQFASDLAQFSQLEQMTNVNKGIEKMNGNSPDQKKFFGASFLGKEVVTSGTSIDLKDDMLNIDIPFKLPRNATNAIIRIYDSKNQMVQQIEKQQMLKGSNLVTWDGVQSDGGRARADVYRVDVHAWDENNEFFKGETKAKGIVTGVYFDENGETILKVDGQKNINLRDVDSFNVPSHNTNKTGNNAGAVPVKQALNNYGNQIDGKQ